MSMTATTPPRPPHRLRSRAGFSLTELVMAMFVLTVGLLAMAGGTGVMIRTVDMAKLQTNRTAALQSAIEEVRATPYENLAEGKRQLGDFTVAWTIRSTTPLSTLMRFEVVGPGRSPGASVGMPVMSRTVTTTFDYRIARP